MQVTPILTDKHDDFHQEKKDIMDAGLKSSVHQQMDDTGARVNGINYYTHILCNAFYTAFFTRKNKNNIAHLQYILLHKQAIHFVLSVLFNQPMQQDPVLCRQSRNMTRRLHWINTEKALFAGIIVIYAEYCLLFIWNTSFVIHGERFFSLLDDAMISMRYAKNFAGGYGLIWNPGGERVEGYTNFLWTLAMGTFHLFGITPAKTSLCIQLLSTVFLIANLFTVRKIALHLSGYLTSVSLASVLLTAFFYPLNNWALRGMEVGVLAFLITLMAWQIMRVPVNKRVGLPTLILMVLAILIRTDMIFLCLALLAYRSIVQWRNSSPVDLRGFVVLASVFLGHTLFRYLYYGDVLPNTYYLKLTGYPVLHRMIDGFGSLWTYLNGVSLVFFLLPFLLLFLYLDKRESVMPLFLVVLIQFGYDVYAGGDIYEVFNIANRYLSIVMPILFILLSWAVITLPSHMTVRLDIRVMRFRINIAAIVVVVVMTYAWYSFNSAHIYASTILAPALEASLDKIRVEKALLIQATTDSAATVAVVAAGAIPYFSGRQSIDMLGKSDKYIARLDAVTRDVFLPGHNKWDYQHSIIQLQPDVIAELWKAPETILPYLGENYDKMIFGDRLVIYYRKYSMHVKRDHFIDYVDSISIASD